MCLFGDCSGELPMRRWVLVVRLSEIQRHELNFHIKQDALAKLLRIHRFHGEKTASAGKRQENYAETTGILMRPPKAEIQEPKHPT
jgi:hypothetical protein